MIDNKKICFEGIVPPLRKPEKIVPLSETAVEKSEVMNHNNHLWIRLSKLKEAVEGLKKDDNHTFEQFQSATLQNLAPLKKAIEKNRERWFGK